MWCLMTRIIHLSKLQTCDSVSFWTDLEKNDLYYQVIIEREVHGDSWKKIGEARKKTITPDAARKLFERAVCSLTIVVRGLAEEG